LVNIDDIVKITKQYYMKIIQKTPQKMIQ